MNYARTLKFAAIQARLRARIGKLPDADKWRVLALAPASELKDGLEGTGMDFWLHGLPGAVLSDGLERHFNGRIRLLLQRTAGWLPAEWNRFSEQLMLAPDIFWISPLLGGEDLGTTMDPGSRLRHAARAAPEQRRRILEQSRFGIFLEDPAPPEVQWLDKLWASIPNLNRTERPPVERLRKTLTTYFIEKSRECDQLATSPREAPEIRLAKPGTWRHHRILEDRFHLLIAGDPFQPCLILVYALFELLTMEKLRALLLCRLFDWPAPPALTGDG